MLNQVTSEQFGDTEPLINQEAILAEEVIPPDPKPSSTALATAEEASTEQQPRNVFSVFIHGTDRLKTKLYICRPFVKVHLVDYDSGQHLKRRYRSAHYQSAYLEPEQTSPCDFRRQKLSAPTWNQLLRFDESFDWIIQPQTRTMLLFELLDCSSDNEEEIDNSTVQRYHKIAWAFLKLVGGKGNEAVNCKRKVRLQLYKIAKNGRRDNGAEGTDVFGWWKKGVRVPYKGTLYVTVKSVRLSHVTNTQTLIPLDTIEQQGQQSSPIMPATVSSQDRKNSSTVETDEVLWSRLPGQPCKVPNKLLMSTVTSLYGVTALKFSTDGRTLACATKQSDRKYPIMMYEIPSGRFKASLVGHLQLIYSVSWSKSSLHILSSSADCMARLWDVAKCLCVQIYPHTEFVYCAIPHPSLPEIALTGAYDGLLRVWTQTNVPEAQLVGEIRAHDSFISCLQVSSDGRRLLTGDGSGRVKVWRVENGGAPFLTPVRSLPVPSRHQVCSIGLPPHNRFIAIHSRDSHLRFFDMRTNSLRHDCLVFPSDSPDYKCGAVLSPCGSVMFCGSPDGTVQVWQSEDGLRLAVYRPLPVPMPLLAIDYHPLDHFLAFAHFGHGAKLFLYAYDAQVPEMYNLETSGTDNNISKVETKTEVTPSYVDYSIRTMLEEHRILTKLTSFEKMALEATESRADKSREAREFRPMYTAVTSSTRADTKTSISNTETPKETAKVVSEKEEDKKIVNNTAIKAAIELAEYDNVAQGRGIDVNTAEEPDQSNEMKMRSEQTSSVIGRAVALFTYKAENKDELSVEKGDQLRIISNEGPEWIIAEKGNIRGYLPASYVEIVTQN